MRKVFFSIMYGQDFHKMKDSIYQSADFDLHEKKYFFPLTYIIANNVQAGEEIAVITSVERGNGPMSNSQVNYGLYQEEVRQVVAEYGATVKFQEIWTEDEYNIMTGKKFFKELNDYIQDGDKLYADITFGIKIFSVTSFIALTYAVRAAKNVSMEHLIYSWQYSTTVGERRKRGEPIVSTIYDVTSLFYLNEIAGQLSEGDRTKVSRVLGL